MKMDTMLLDLYQSLSRHQQRGVSVLAFMTLRSDSGDCYHNPLEEVSFPGKKKKREASLLGWVVKVLINYSLNE